MSTSDRTINQVRAILNKLDRSIDEAREKRTHIPPPTPMASQPIPVPAPVQAVPAPSPSTSQYGRAQPMPKAAAANILRWKS